jgi:hypothetical protein
MPLYSIDIEKRYDGEYWTNRYIVLTPTIGEARADAQEFVTAERAVHNGMVLFTQVRTSDMDPATDSYFSDPINAYGTPNPQVDKMPLFNVVRVDFAVAQGGRPSRKYLRLPLTESDQSNGFLTSTIIDFVLTNYVQPVLLIGTYADVDGSPISGGSVFPRVGMRQLRRARKRKIPVLGGTPV